MASGASGFLVPLEVLCMGPLLVAAPMESPGLLEEDACLVEPIQTRPPNWSSLEARGSYRASLDHENVAVADCLSVDGKAGVELAVKT